MVPQNITDDLTTLSNDIDAQNAAAAAKTKTAADLAAAQTADAAAATAVTTAAAKTGTDEQTLLNDIATWVTSSPTPPAPTDVQVLIRQFRSILVKRK